MASALPPWRAFNVHIAGYGAACRTTVIHVSDKCLKTVGTNIVNALTSHTSLTREQAIEVLTALKDDLIPCAKIHY
ncbi:hypothetical protein ACM6ZZ_002332 [Citrobacter freundii]|nr:hypothetical protein [Citrobacter freundii]ELA3552895.1 hypothetical protein [Citrobacter freundii]HBC6388264.1 hypothetical protein [Citrobacter freundii]